MRHPKYSEYKDSEIDWLGMVPTHWQTKKLKYAARLKSGASIKSDAIEDSGDYAVFGGNGKRGYTDSYTNDGNYVLIGRQGALCGNINYASGKFWASEHAVIVTPEPDIVLNWIGELLRAMNLNQYSIAAAQPGLAVDQIRNLGIPIPPLPEQRAIASFLDCETARIDTLIDKKQKLIARLQEKRTALISRTVTRGLPPEVARAAGLDPHPQMKDSGVEWIGEVPAHWRITELKYEAILKGRLGWQGLKAEEYRDEGPYVVSSAHFQNESVQWHLCPRVSEERYLLDKKIQLQPYDILLMKDGAALGKLAYVDKIPGPACLNSHLLLIRPLKATFVPKYLFYLFTTGKFQDYMQIYGTGATFLGVSQRDIGNFPFAVPSIKEQTQIADFLDRKTAGIDTMTSKIQVAIERLLEYRSALITAAVTGKIDVREAVS